MGGVGKTTLASIVYNDLKRDQVFQKEGWVSVSEKNEVNDVIKSLLESVTKEDSKTSNNSEYLQNELKKELQNKRFLLVLDDIWSDIVNRSKWETLKTIFEVGAPGSRIIVTTREECVTHIVNTAGTSPYKLNVLSDDESWSLFQRHAFQSSSAYPDLEIIGKEIVSKCKGLPLAIKMLGGLLSSKPNDELEWKEVLQSKIWNSTNDILPSLWLSYYHLSFPIRQCFAYFSIFPKNYSFSMDEMVRFWVAEGFVVKPRESSSNDEDEARTYFKQLCSNFFIQESSMHESWFQMHDLVHDLAEYVSKGSRVDLNNVNRESRRLPLVRDQNDVLLNAKSIRKLSHLRTFLPSNLRYGLTSCRLFTDKVCNDLLSNFKLLRVLSLARYAISALPSSIGDMKLLRHLNISGTEIEYLPHWIRRLYNLQTLDVSCCHRLKSLPSSVCELVNLRHLIAKRDYFEAMGIPYKNRKSLQTRPSYFEGIPYGIGKMTSIQTLPAFVICEGKSKQMREYGELNNLRGSLQISGLNNVDDLQDVITADFRNKEYLKELILKWNPNRERDTTLDERVLDVMQSHSNLKKLTIESYGGKKLPKWIVGESPSLTRMVSLHIVNCFNCEALPSLGHLPCLEDLSIEGLDCMESLGEEFYGDTENPFPTLQTLEVSNMKAIKKWYFPKGDRRGFSSLKDLRIDNCPQLSAIPICFPQLTKLDISSCGIVRLGVCSAENGLTLTTCGDGFSSLKDLRIHNCPQLSAIPYCFPQLTKLDIASCDQLVRLGVCSAENGSTLTTCGDGFSSLKDLRIFDCPQLSAIPICFPQLTKLDILSCDQLVRLGVCSAENGSTLTTCGDGFSSLKDLQISHCPQLSAIPYCFPQLTKLDISSCSSLVRLEVCSAENGLNLTTCGDSLEHIVIRDCPKLEELPKSFVNLFIAKIINCDSLSIEGVIQDLSAATLEKLVIDVCSVSNLLSRLTSLKYLDLQIKDNDDKKIQGSEDDSDSMIRLPPNLSTLTISGGFNSNSMTDIGRLNSLNKLCIKKCHDLQLFPNVELPLTLKSLEISDCNALKSIPDSFLCRCDKSLVDFSIAACPNLACLPDGVSALQSLQRLYVSSCPLIQHFPTRNSPQYFINLSDLRIDDLPALKSLPDGFHNIISLDTLNIYNCPNLVIPEDGFPSKLRSIIIFTCGKMRPISEMKLANLTSLQFLLLLDFPETSTLDHCLPESIDTLILIKFPDLKSLSGVLSNLKKLKRLTVGVCPLVTRKAGLSKKLKQKYPNIIDLRLSEV
ncbi:unnamed protein product [Rhodiola kirilowii]